MISPDGELSHKSTVFLDRHPLCGVEIVNCYRDGFLPEKPRHIDPEAATEKTPCTLHPKPRTLNNNPPRVRILDVIDLVIVAYFSLEFLVRIGVSTNKIYFCRRALNSPYT
ncbi:hypothetical protein T484DRAFT_1744044 [Baffinella frigidus]|nr:hypothetical protein T484DRAFT_1744044 [Cryptophyta sp. CCMP2293]